MFLANKWVQPSVDPPPTSQRQAIISEAVACRYNPNVLDTGPFHHVPAVFNPTVEHGLVSAPEAADPLLRKFGHKVLVGKSPASENPKTRLSQMCSLQSPIQPWGNKQSSSTFDRNSPFALRKSQLVGAHSFSFSGL